IGFNDVDEPKFRYVARYSMQHGCHSPLSYTIDADVAFAIKKESFTSVRIIMPNDFDKNDKKNNKEFAKLVAKDISMQPNAVCVSLTVEGESADLRSCKNLKDIQQPPKR